MILYFFLSKLSHILSKSSVDKTEVFVELVRTLQSHFYQKFLKLFFGRYQTRARSCSSYQSWWPPRSFWLFQSFVLFPSELNDTTRSVPNLTPLRTPVTFLSQSALTACFLKLSAVFSKIVSARKISLSLRKYNFSSLFLTLLTSTLNLFRK